MYVCICNGVTDKQIVKQAQSGAHTLRDLQDSLGVATCCGKCAKLACSIMDDYHQQHPVIEIARNKLQAVAA